MNSNYEHGAFSISRSLFESDIWFMPPHYVKLWIWLIGKCNHKDSKNLKRGECFTTYEETRQQTKYMSGYRTECLSTEMVRSFYGWLHGKGMGTTRRTTRGIIVTLLKYSDYQTLENYGPRYGDRTDTHTEKSRRRFEPQSIYKNEKNETNKQKNEKISKISSKYANHTRREKPNWPKPHIDPNTWKTWEDVPMELTKAEEYNYKYGATRQEWSIYLEFEEEEGTIRRKIHRHYYPERYPS